MPAGPSVDASLVQEELNFSVSHQVVPIPNSSGAFHVRTYVTPRVGSRLLHVGEVAAQIGMSPRSVRRMLEAGVIPSHRPGLRRRQVFQRDVDGYLRGIGVTLH